MKKLIKLFCLLLFFTYPAELLSAPAEGVGTVSANVVSALSVEQSKELNFGTILPEAGVISIDFSGNRTSTGSNLVDDSANPPSYGEMMVYGPVSQVVYVENIQNTVLNSGGNSMNVTNFQTNPSGNITLTSLDGTPVKVGAQLTVATDQPDGDYTGTYTLTVTY